MSIRFPALVLLLYIVLSSTSCLNDKLGDKCEASYYTVSIKPLLISNCANTIDCHVSGGNAGADFNRYEEVFRWKDEVIRRISLDANDAAFMPRGGLPLTATDIQLLKEWVAAGALGCDN